MTNDDTEIESLLVRYRPAGPDAALRGRILRQTPQRAQRSYWSFLEAMAALLLIGLNLAQISASVTDFIPPPPIDLARTQQIAAQIRHLDLPVTPAETEAMAQRLASGERLVMLPQIHGPTNLHFDIGATP
ncbi:MAG: hypothetical protein WCI73_18630 [Phycisphaerae bacterium]